MTGTAVLSSLRRFGERGCICLMLGLTVAAGGRTWGTLRAAQSSVPQTAGQSSQAAPAAESQGNTFLKPGLRPHTVGFDYIDADGNLQHFEYEFADGVDPRVESAVIATAKGFEYRYVVTNGDLARQPIRSVILSIGAWAEVQTPPGWDGSRPSRSVTRSEGRAGWSRMGISAGRITAPIQERITGIGYTSPWLPGPVRAEFRGVTLTTGDIWDDMPEQAQNELRTMYSTLRDSVFLEVIGSSLPSRYSHPDLTLDALIVSIERAYNPRLEKARHPRRSSIQADLRSVFGLAIREQQAEARAVIRRMLDEDQGKLEPWLQELKAALRLCLEHALTVPVALPQHADRLPAQR